MSNPNKPQVTELPVQWQSVTVDVESIAPILNFVDGIAYDVANMTALVNVNVPEARIYRLLLSCDVESGTRATARVASSDEAFDKVERFERISKQDASDYIPLLDKSGLVAADATTDDKLKYIRNNFKEVLINIPSGQQKIRIHASKKLVHTPGNPREFTLVQFAPLLGFTIAGGQTNLSLAVTFPPAFEGGNIAIDTPLVEPIPGQPVPSDAVPPHNGVIGAVHAFAWHWRTDPKVTIKYRYQ